MHIIELLRRLVVSGQSTLGLGRTLANADWYRSRKYISMSTTAQGARSHCLTRLLLTQPELLVLLMLIVGCLVGTYHHEGPPLLRCLLRCFLDSRARPGTRKKLLGPLIAASLCSTAGSRGHPTRHLRCQKTTHFRLVVIRHGFGQIN